MNVDQLKAVIAEAQAAGYAAAQESQNKMGGDWGACGFAWIEFFGYQGKNIDGRSRIGKLLKSVGITQDYKRTFYLWNPSQFASQSVDVLEDGANAALKVFRDAGFTAYAVSRLD